MRLRTYSAAFGGLLLRDARVLVRESVPFVLRTVMNPLLFVFVFAYVFPTIGQGLRAPQGVSFATVIVPGLVAVAIVFQGISAVALPLVHEFGGTREIEDRVMAPLPVAAVAAEKVVFGAMQSVVAALLVFPLTYLVPAGDVAVRLDNWPLLLLVIVLASLTAGSLGLFVGTVVRPQQVQLIFSILVIPITFLGCVYYPWASLDAIPWLRVAVLVNPLVYMSEGLRAALTPDVPSMPAWAFLGAITIALAALSFLGIRSFTRRVQS